MTEALKEHPCHLCDTSQIKNVHKNVLLKYFNEKRKNILLINRYRFF